MKIRSVLTTAKILFVVCWLISPAHAQYDSNRVLEYLQETFNNQDTKLDDYLIGELDRYIEIFSRGANGAQAQHLLAQFYERKGSEHEALAAYLKTMHLFPGTDQHTQSASAARALIANEKTFKEKTDMLLATVDGSFDKESQSDRYFAYLKFLTDFKESRLNEWTITEANRFIARYPDDARVSEVLKMIAEIYSGKGDHHQAASTYRKLEYAYPNNELLPAVRYSRALLLYQELGKHEQAIAAFGQIANEHSDTDYAGKSIFYSGEVKEKKTKDYPGAIADYRTLVESYSTDGNVVEALFRIAQIQEDKTKDYPAAIATYDEIVEKHKDNQRGVKALEESGKLYKDKLKDYGKAAQQYARVAEAYPSDENAPDMIIEAGSISEDKLKDYDAAINYYEIVLDKYSEHKKAREAEKRIKRVRDKITKEEARN